MGLMESSFVWIVTDAITGEPETLSYNGSYPSYYQGLLGTVPAYGQNTSTFNTFKDKYITEYGGSAANLMMSSGEKKTKVSSSAKLLSHVYLYDLRIIPDSRFNFSSCFGRAGHSSRDP